jgi:hypothetical protein
VVSSLEAALAADGQARCARVAQILAAKRDADDAKWRPIIKAAGLKAD